MTATYARSSSSSPCAASAESLTAEASTEGGGGTTGSARRMSAPNVGAGAGLASGGSWIRVQYRGRMASLGFTGVLRKTVGVGGPSGGDQERPSRGGKEMVRRTTRGRSGYHQGIVNEAIRRATRG